MELRTKFAGYYSFLNIKVDEIETDIFDNDEDAVKLIENLLSVIKDLCTLIDKEFNYEIKDYEYLTKW